MGPCWPLVSVRDLGTKYLSISRMADGSDRCEVHGTDSEWSLFFTDLDELLCKYEQHESTNDITLKENLAIRLENAVQALQNLSPFVSDANRKAVPEMTRNFQLMFWNCY